MQRYIADLGAILGSKSDGSGKRMREVACPILRSIYRSRFLAQVLRRLSLGFASTQSFLWLLTIWIRLYIIYSMHFIVTGEVAGEDNNILAATVSRAILKSKENKDRRICSTKFWIQDC
ncbi:hypothetical protein Q3G72_033090 [Acer saccharum]|nr:hypothetical protein Q3G72_033090 [Acer saccharum]